MRAKRAIVRASVRRGAVCGALLIIVASFAALPASAAVVPAATARFYYASPLRLIRHLHAKRIDEGVDYSGSGPIKAMGTATITVVDRGTSRFWANQFGNVVVERMDDGPLQGVSIYNAENCTPSPALHVGQHVTAATTLCRLHDQFPFLEIGFAQRNRSGVPSAWVVYRHVPDGSKTAYGVDFSHLLGDLGAPEGNTNNGSGDKSYDPSRTVGKLRRGFPRF